MLSKQIVIVRSTEYRNKLSRRSLKDRQRSRDRIKFISAIYDLQYTKIHIT